MARGWESKSVEEQQSERAHESRPTRARLSPAQQERIRERDGLVLTRKRLLEQLQTASHPRHRQMLEQSLAELDKQLSSFEDLTEPPAPK